MCLCYDEGLWCKCREERATLWSQFFCLAPFLWVPGIQLRSPSLHSKGIYPTSSLSVPELFIFGKSENTMGSSEIPSQNLENSWRNRQDRKQRLRKLRLLRVPATVQLLHGCCAQALPRLSPRSCPDGSHAPFHPIKTSARGCMRLVVCGCGPNTWEVEALWVSGLPCLKTNKQNLPYAMMSPDPAPFFFLDPDSLFSS